MPLVSSFLLPRQAFSPSCPSGGTFYACQSGTNFVGCCNSEASSNGCSDGNLEPASFNTAYYGQFKDQECPTGSRWYTCTGTKPPFMGCCKSNPCSNDGCPAGDLTAGFLSSNPKSLRISYLREQQALPLLARRQASSHRALQPVRLTHLQQYQPLRLFPLQLLQALLQRPLIR